MMTEAPCRECPDRNAGCHSGCPKYKEWQRVHVEELIKINKVRMKKQIVDLYTKSSVVKVKESIRKKEILGRRKYHRRIFDESIEMEADKRKLCADSVHVPDREMD